MKEILQMGADMLRKKAEKVAISNISGKETQEIVKNMKEALSREEDGVAIAAPQIGYSKRIFVVADRVFDQEARNAPKVYINPVIIKTSRDKTFLDEGCLSVRWKYGEVERANKVTVEAHNEKGEKFQRGASGLLAQIFQHEIDHLDGVLFIDKAENLSEYNPEEMGTKEDTE